MDFLKSVADMILVAALFIAGGIILVVFLRLLLYFISIEVEDSKWTAIRKGNMNFLITNCHKWYIGFVRASEVCKLLKIQEKRKES